MPKKISNVANSQHTDKTDTAYSPDTIRIQPPIDTKTVIQERRGKKPASSKQDGKDGSGASHASKPFKTKSTKKRVAIVCASVFGALLLVYFAGVVVFSNFFMPGTTIRGYDVSLQSISAVADQLASYADDYEISVSGDNIELSISGDEVSLSVDAHTVVSNAHEQQNPWWWPIEITTQRTLEVNVLAEYDEDALATLLDPYVEAANEGATQTSDASYTYDTNQHAFVVVPEVYGTEFDASLVVQEVGEAISQLETDIELGDACKSQPDRAEDDEDLVQLVADANEYTNVSFSLMLGSSTVMDISADIIKDWLDITAEDDGSYTVTLSEELVTSWVETTLAAQVDTVGTTRTYTRLDGKSVTVTGGTYGWTIDQAAAVSSLMQAVENHSSESVYLTTTSEGETWTAAGGQDWGTTYVDIDLTEQHAYYFLNGSLVWESDLVSGDTSTGYSTPVGVYVLNNKLRNQTLIGLDDNGDGEPDYNTPVSYWMPFIGNMIGLHDATWRSSFGGTIYTYDGSHGCINLPEDKAAELYEILEIGTVVISHW